MFFSNFIPVNINRNNGAVYSGDCVYPVDLIVKVHEALTTGNTTDVIVDNGVINVLTKPDIKWQLTDFYLAYNAYITAKNNDFSYYAVKGDNDTPALFISKQFQGQRIMVNAYTMKSCIVTGKNKVARIASMIDHTYSNMHCFYIYEVISNILNGSAKYLKGVIVNKDSDMEYMAVNPILTNYSEYCIGYGKNCIDDFRRVLNGETVTDGFEVVGGQVKGIGDLDYLPLMNVSHVEEMVNLYDSIITKNVSYLPIYSESSDEPIIRYFLSTDTTTLVDAETFECVKLHNMHTKMLFASFASKECCGASELQLGWMLAKTE